MHPSTRLSGRVHLMRSGDQTRLKIVSILTRLSGRVHLGRLKGIRIWTTFQSSPDCQAGCILWQSENTGLKTLQLHFRREPNSPEFSSLLILCFPSETFKREKRAKFPKIPPISKNFVPFARRCVFTDRFWSQAAWEAT